MQKLTSRQKKYLLRTQFSRWSTNLERKGKKHNPHKITSTKDISGQSIIFAPEYISIYETHGPNSNYTRTMQFIADIHKLYKIGNCLLDFSTTRKISAAALVVVYAAIEIAGTGRNGRVSISLSSESEGVNKAIRSSNLLRLIKGHDITYALNDARSMPIISSVGNEQMEEIIDFIQRRIFNDNMTPDTEHVYGDAVSETINNVGLHAYPDTDLGDRRWWLMCSTFGRQLYLAIYDVGVGIPKTVVDQPWFFPLLQHSDPEQYRKIVEEMPELGAAGIKIIIPKRIPDERLIYYSMQSDVSGTKKEKHGQGSKSIKALVNDTEDGLLWVFSNNGLYTFNVEDQQPGEAKLRMKFPGTLVQWNIEIS